MATSRPEASARYRQPRFEVSCAPSRLVVYGQGLPAAITWRAQRCLLQGEPGGSSDMGLFDTIKDILTTDDKEKAAKAKAVADEAQRQADEASKKAQEAQQQAEAASVKAGLSPDPAVAEAKAQADAAAAAATQAAEEAAAEAQRVQEAHDAHIAEEAVKAEKAAEAAAAARIAKPAPAPAAAAPLRTYTVVSGDTLSGIGQKFGVNWHEIASLNHVSNPDLIHPGQVFKIPHS